MTPWAAALVSLIELHGPNGQRYFINPEQVTSVREPLRRDMKHFSPTTRCVIATTNGGFLAVMETCDRVRALVEGAPRPQAQ